MLSGRGGQQEFKTYHKSRASLIVAQWMIPPAVAGDVGSVPGPGDPKCRGATGLLLTIEPVL